MLLVCVLLNVALWKLLIIYFYIAQFSVGGGGSQVLNTLLNVIWFATVWEIWKERNNKIFKDKDCSIMRIVDKIKSISFSWLKEKFVQFSFNYHGWWLSPLAMLGYR